MIKKKFKLKTKDIKEIFEKKHYKKLSNKDFLIIYKENNLSYPRFVVICKKNIFKKAVSRNKIKRRICEIIRQKIIPKELKINYDFLIFPTKDENFVNLKNSLLKIFKKINV